MRTRLWVAAGFVAAGVVTAAAFYHRTSKLTKLTKETLAQLSLIVSRYQTSLQILNDATIPALTVKQKLQELGVSLQPFTYKEAIHINPQLNLEEPETLTIQLFGSDCVLRAVEAELKKSDLFYLARVLYIDGGLDKDDLPYGDCLHIEVTIDSEHPAAIRKKLALV